MVLPPSGEQVVLTAGASARGARAVVVSVGGGVRSCEVGGLAVLDGYGEDEMASAGRGQPLLPWPNRVDAGRWSWGGRDLQLPLSEPARGNAIHGLVRWSGWRLERPAPSTAVARHTLQPQPGYPFRLDCRTTYSLAADGLEVGLEVVNRSPERAPLGVGWHPYVTAGAATVDPCLLTLPAATRLRTDERGLPAGREPVEGSAYDFRTGRPIGDLVLDTPFTDLARDDDGLVRVRLAGPEHIVTVWADGAYAWLQVFTGDTVSPPERRRRGLAVEPMTCPPNALATSQDLVVLDPGATWRGRWGVSVAACG